MRFMGVNLIGVIAGAVVFWLLGWLWYGVLFVDPWMSGHRFTADQFEGASPAWMLLGAIISLLTAFFLARVMSWGGMPDVPGAIVKALTIWLGFGLTAALYTLAYSPYHSVPLLLVEGGYTLFGWLLAAAIISILR